VSVGVSVLRAQDAAALKEADPDWGWPAIS
jgi:hypothetical protein